MPTSINNQASHANPVQYRASRAGEVEARCLCKRDKPYQNSDRNGNRISVQENHKLHANGIGADHKRQEMQRELKTFAGLVHATLANARQ